MRWDDFAGKYRIVYFGYTFCPDACPMDVAAMMQGFARFEKYHPRLAGDVQPMFISIDPARDTPKVVGEFAMAFSPRLLGLTGSRAAGRCRPPRRSPPTTPRARPPGRLSHGSQPHRLSDGPEGCNPISMLPVDKGPQAVAAELAKWVK